MSEKNGNSKANGEGTHYPDLPPAVLGNLKKIERLPAMLDSPPKVRFGSEYLGWTLTKRLQYAEQLAHSMNHAADILQQERNALSVVAIHQEDQIKHLVGQFSQQSDLMAKLTGESNEAKQGFMREIVELRAQVRARDELIKDMGG